MIDMPETGRFFCLDMHQAFMTATGNWESELSRAVGFKRIEIWFLGLDAQRLS